MQVCLHSQSILLLRIDEGLVPLCAILAHAAETEVSCLLQHQAVGPSSSCCSSILPPEIDAAGIGVHQQQTQKNTAGRLLHTESPGRCRTGVLRYGRLHDTSWHASLWASRE